MIAADAEAFGFPAPGGMPAAGGGPDRGRTLAPDRAFIRLHHQLRGIANAVTVRRRPEPSGPQR